MSLFSGLYVGKSGLQSSQNALNTVAHNLSNINTPGYVRQQVAQSDINYNTIFKNFFQDITATIFWRNIVRFVYKNNRKYKKSKKFRDLAQL